MCGSDFPDQLTHSPTRLPRFSLLTLLLLTSIAALSLTLVLLWREVQPLRVANKRLNEERGALMIEDPSALQAIRIPGRFAGEGRECYRIFVPKNSLYWAFVVVNDIPKQGYPKVQRYPEKYSMLGSGTNMPLHGRLEPGEHVLTIRKVRRGANRSDIQLIIDGLYASAQTPAHRWPTVEPETYRAFGEGVKGETTAADPSGRLVLHRRRLMGVSEESLNVSYTMREPDRVLDGVMVWIEPDPRGKSK
jgi:hypothetical protein